jgi:hypothetical protein
MQRKNHRPTSNCEVLTNDMIPYYSILG